MLSTTLKITPFAALSRSVCGTRDNTLILTLPGSAKAAMECLEAVLPVLSHAVDLMLGRTKKTEKFHQKLSHTCTHTLSNDPSKPGTINKYK